MTSTPRVTSAPPAGAAEDMVESTTPTLVEEHRAAARDRIVRAARTVLAQRGLAARVEDVAEAAAVSRRTVFRYFETREALLAAALTDSMRSYGDRIPRHQPGEPLAAWLDRALVAVHTMNAHHGQVYFELMEPGTLPGQLAEVAQLRRSAREELVRRFTLGAWRAAGGRGRPPAWLLDTVAILLSAFATESLVGDFGRTPEQVGHSTARALGHAVEGAVAEQAGG